MTVGLAMLAVGGDVLVRGAAGVARRLGVSPLLIGLTVVGFGTSTPELFTSLKAALTGSPGIALGSVVGSNIANALLILGVTALVAPIAVDQRAFRRDAIALTLATGALVWAVLQGRLTHDMGVVAIALLAIYLVVVWMTEHLRAGVEGRRIAATADTRSTSASSLWVAVVLAVGGIGMTVWGANLLVGGAVVMARQLGVSDTLVGLTIVAVGTSLPELVTSLIAALKKQGEVALGNVIGSNLYNSLGILGMTAAIRPIDVPPVIARLDIWVLVAATAAMIVFARRRGKITRGEGLLLLVGYAAYIGWLIRTA